MEQELNSHKEFESDLYHFKLQYKNQTINDNLQFQNWKENAIDYIKENNRNCTHTSLLLLLNFCNNCCSYSIFTMDNFSLIKCHNCHYEFCIGCGKEPLSKEDNSTCFKGFLKACYLRAFNESTEMLVHHPVIIILHIIFSLFFTPQYIGFIFNMLGFLQHQRSSRLNNGIIHDFTADEYKLLAIYIFSIIKGFLCFPYAITFFPFIVILLLPGLFSKEYYLKIFTFYLNVVMAGGTKVKDKYW